jgi:hypothetical protein
MPASSWLTTKMTGSPYGRETAGLSVTPRSGFRESRSSARKAVHSPRAIAFSSARPNQPSQDGREIDATVERLRHIDYGYASTSHSSQGATVDRVIVNIDTARSAELVNRKQFYVSISRARHNISVYTDDRNRLDQVTSRSREKSMALERLRSDSNHSFKVLPERTLTSQSRSYSLRR